MPDAPNRYDEFPYESVALYETNPDRAASVATLFGLVPPPVDSARVLELGCAGGGNLIPLAQILPRATFVGVDLSPRQIEQAEALAKAAGVANVTFLALSLADITPEFGRFDYIICHGVYSWVPDAVKEAVLRVCAENLVSGGLAYVSYNTFPGWHFPGMIREMMLHHVRNTRGPAARVKSARAFLDFLGQNAVDREGHYGKILQDEATQLRVQNDPYVAHEHLEEINDPVYFSEFARRVAGHGLRVLGDSRFWTMAAATQPPISGVLDRLAHDPIDREQYFDFLCNRRFRRSILCHAGPDVLAAPTIEQVRLLRVETLVWPAVDPVDFSSKVKVEFRASDGATRITTSEPVFKAALIALAEVFPASLSFDAIWGRTRSLLGRAGIEAGESADLLAARLLQAHTANAVELITHEPEILAARIDLLPRGFPIARHVAESSTVVPNVRHRQARLGDFDRLVLRHLDGRSTQAEVVERLILAVQAGEFPINQAGRDLKDAESLRPILERSLGPSLQRLARNALLVRAEPLNDGETP